MATRQTATFKHCNDYSVVQVTSASSLIHPARFLLSKHPRLSAGMLSILNKRRDDEVGAVVDPVQRALRPRELDFWHNTVGSIRCIWVQNTDDTGVRGGEGSTSLTGCASLRPAKPVQWTCKVVGHRSTEVQCPRRLDFDCLCRPRRDPICTGRGRYSALMTFRPTCVF